MSKRDINHLEKEGTNQFQRLHHNILTMLAGKKNNKMFLIKLLYFCHNIFVEIESKSVESIVQKNDANIWNRNAKAFYASCFQTGKKSILLKLFKIDFLIKI